MLMGREDVLAALQLMMTSDENLHAFIKPLKGSFPLLPELKRLTKEARALYVKITKF